MSKKEWNPGPVKVSSKTFIFPEDTFYFQSPALNLIEICTIMSCIQRHESYVNILNSSSTTSTSFVKIL